MGYADAILGRTPKETSPQLTKYSDAILSGGSEELISTPTAAPQGPVDFSASEMVSNVPKSMMNLAVSFAQPFIHPIDTAQAVGNLALGVAEKAVPGEQDAEIYADQAGKFIMDRYGSLDNFKETVMQDPVGVLADASSVLMAGGGLVRGAGSMAAKAPGMVGRVGAGAERVGQAAMTAGAAIDPLNVVTNTVKAGAAMLPDSLPRTMFEASAKWRPSIPQDKRKQLTETALAEGIVPSEAGALKIEGIIAGLNDKIDELIQAADATGATIPKSAIYRELKQLRRDMGGAKVDAPKDLRKIDAIVKRFDEYMVGIGKTELTPSELQAFKQDAYKHINFDTKRGVASLAENETKKAMARAAKKELEKISPEIKDLNAREGALIELQPEIERAAGRIDNRNVIGLDSAAKVTTGAVVGGSAGANIAAAIAAVGSPKIRAHLAIQIAKYQKQGVPAAYIENNILPAMLREAGIQSGKLNEKNGQSTTPKR